MPHPIPFTNRTVGDIIADIREQMPVMNLPGDSSKRALGTRFEELFRVVALRAAPRIDELDVQNAWLWRDWPDLAKHGLTGQDTGIDVVLQQNDGTLIAVQCKCYDSDNRVGKGDIVSFIVADRREFPAHNRP